MSTSTATPVVTEDMSCKVFVGNLSYQTRESELKDIFSKSGTVADVKIISYHNRSKGYGFITMSSESEAKKAVEELKGHEFDGRAMNVELVTPQPPREERPKRAGRGRGTSRRGGRGASSRPSNSERPNSGTISKTVIYIGNLPYGASEDDLKTIFAGYNVTNAHIVRRANGQSKGYGFVYVATEEDQSRALTDLVNVECDDRPLHIKAAHSEEPYDERKKAAEATLESA